ncbi:MAG: ABC transporter permease [Armatimonadetes bacterium]|nr:ABC transporter permease [Armatimonadota bacterium]MBX3109115.1 ABC transporter permease [Fimbriimonadaceae bacterium]
MAFRDAIQSLFENIRGSLLSTVGVAVASIAILLLVSIGLGVQKDITGQIDGLGADLLIVVPGRIDLGSFNPNIGGKSFLTPQSADEIARLDGVKHVAQLSFAGGGIQAEKLEAYPVIIAATPEWLGMQPGKLKEGRYFTPQEAKGRVCVIGSIAADELFPNSSAVGKNVTVNGEPYRVVGVIQDQHSESSPFSAFSLVNVVYIPLPYIQSTQQNVQIDRIMVQIDNSVDPKLLLPKIKQVLGRRLQDSQFSVLTQEDLLKLVFDVLGILGTLVVGLTSIALAVGGLGIMTVMLMSVGERTREIGVRLAVGASRRAIFRQFLLESALIGLAGVLMGLAVSAATIYAIAATTSIKPLLTGGTVAMTLATGVGLGILFGVAPAAKASRMHPVECLRHE